MAVSPTSSINAAQAASLSLNDLLRVLLTELTHQDPLKPVDNTEFMAQIAQFASLEATQQSSQGVQQMVGLQALNQTMVLMGRFISATLDNGTTVSGTVTSVTITNGTPQVTIRRSDGSATPGISIGNIQTITNPGQ